MSDSPDLTPEDVSEILRIVDSSQFDEFELETPRLTIRFRRGEPPVTGSAPPPAGPAEPDAGLIDVSAPMVGTFYRSPGPGEPSVPGPGASSVPGPEVPSVPAPGAPSAPGAGAVTGGSRSAGGVSRGWPSSSAR